jgi:hypothetical protein
VRFLVNVSITYNQTFLIDFFVNWLTDKQMFNERERERKKKIATCSQLLKRVLKHIKDMRDVKE